jgi:RimJ/RimL family protein N-acetyltransferase
MLGPVLRGQRVTLGPIGPEHLPAYCAWLADPEVTRFLGRDNPPSLRDEQEWFDRVAASPTDVVWGLFADDRHIGGTGLHQIDWRHRRATSGIFIGDKARWGQGIGGEAMQLRTRYAFDRLGLEKVVTKAFEANVASRRGLERAGYRTVGVHRRHFFRDGRWSDVWLAELLREDWLRLVGRAP